VKRNVWRRDSKKQKTEDTKNHRGAENLRRQGFCVGRICTSLMKLPGACVTIAATACATSSGCSIFAGSLPTCGENSVATEPGQIALTRMPCARRSSAMHPVRPRRPHLDAQYIATFANVLFPP